MTKAATINAEAEAAKASLTSLYVFMRNFWGVLNADPYVDNFHIREICAELDHYARAVTLQVRRPDLIINIPPGMSKSTIVSQMFPAYLWLHAPWAVVVSSSYAQALSTDHAIKSRQVVLSEQYRRWFGLYFAERFGEELYLVKDTERNYQNNFGGARVATSTGSAITGKHGHIILIDDPINPEQAVSATQREKANRFKDRTLSSRKKNKALTPTIMVMQRLHAEDPTGHELEKGKELRQICLPAELSENVMPERLRAKYTGRLLDPKRLPRAVLDRDKKDLGSYGYAGQMQQNPAPDGGGVIKPDWFPRYNAAQLPWDNLVTHFYLDSAYTEKAENDPSVLLAFVYYLERLYIVRVGRVWMEFPELVRWIPEQMRICGASENSALIIEPKASGLSIGQTLRDGPSPLNVIFDEPPKDPKLVRATAMSPFWEAGRVLVPEEANWLGDFFEELKLFPKAKTADQVDTLEGATRNFLFNRRPASSMQGAAV